MIDPVILVTMVSLGARITAMIERWQREGLVTEDQIQSAVTAAKASDAAFDDFAKSLGIDPADYNSRGDVP